MSTPSGALHWIICSSYGRNCSHKIPKWKVFFLSRWEKSKVKQWNRQGRAFVLLSPGRILVIRRVIFLQTKWRIWINSPSICQWFACPKLCRYRWTICRCSCVPCCALSSFTLRPFCFPFLHRSSSHRVASFAHTPGTVRWNPWDVNGTGPNSNGPTETEITNAYWKYLTYHWSIIDLWSKFIIPASSDEQCLRRCHLRTLGKS